MSKTITEPSTRSSPKITRAEADTAAAWDLTWAGWCLLTDKDRADKRENLTNAPKFNQENR